MATRADFFSIDFMMESTPGVDPGIVAAPYVTVTDVTEGKYVPNLTNADKAFALLAAAPEGLPELKTVEIPEMRVVRDYGSKRLRGLKNEGEITLTFNAHGWSRAPGTDRPAPPPWLQLAASGCGHLYGNVAAVDTGGVATPLATVAPDVLTAGCTVLDGHVIAVKDVNATTPTVHCARPSNATAQTVTAYQIAPGFTTEADDEVWPTCQTHFDYRNDAIGPVGGSNAPVTYTILVNQADINAAQMFFGCRANKIEIEGKVGAVVSVKITFIYDWWSTYTEGGANWTGYAVKTAKPKYGTTCYDLIWPDPEVLQRANLVWIDTADSNARKAPHIAGFKWGWEAGYTRFNAETGVEGVGGIFATGAQRVSMSRSEERRVGKECRSRWSPYH